MSYQRSPRYSYWPTSASCKISEKMHIRLLAKRMIHLLGFLQLLNFLEHQLLRKDKGRCATGLEEDGPWGMRLIIFDERSERLLAARIQKTGGFISPFIHDAKTVDVSVGGEGIQKPALQISVRCTNQGARDSFPLIRRMRGVGTGLSSPRRFVSILTGRTDNAVN
ncbi:hypothetical protein AB1N83_010892 [Pleurotus pulmonarius]